jgi:hypothetical protein
MATFVMIRCLLVPGGLLSGSRHARLLIRLLCVLLVAASGAEAQKATLRGQVFDQTGAVVPRATIILTDSQGKTTTGISSNEGLYVLGGLFPGKYYVLASTPDLAQEPVNASLRK